MRRSATFGGVIGLAGVGSGFYFGDAPVAALAVLAALSVSLLVIGAWAAGAIPKRERVPIATLKTASAPLMAGLVLLSVFTAPVAAGDDNFGFKDCGFDDSVTGAFISSFIDPNEDGECRFNPDDQSLAGHLDAYEKGKTLAQQEKTYLTTINNYGTDKDAIAWSEAKITLINSINANESEANASVSANESVDRYYSYTVNNSLQHYSAAMSDAEYTWKANNSWVTLNQSNYQIKGFATLRAETLNGSQMTVRTMVIADQYGNPPEIVVPGMNPMNDSSAENFNISEDISDFYSPEYNNNTSNINEIVPTNGVNSEVQYTSPNAGDPNVTVVNPEGYAQQVIGLYGDAERIRANIDQYTSEVYSNYSSGELSATDVVGAGTLASRSSTNYNSTGYYSYLAIQLASLGYSGDFNTSARVNYNGTSYNGTLFYTADDVDTFSNGTTYNPNNLNGTTIMAASSNGTGEIVELTDHNFTIVDLTNPKTGESLNNTSLEQYNYNTTNASNLQSELEALAKLRKQYEETQSDGGGGSGLLGGNATAGIAIIAAVGAIYAIGRSDN